MKSKQNNSDLDLVTPIIEVITELSIVIGSLTFELSKKLFFWITNMTPPVEKIEKKRLTVKKTTLNSEALGIDTKTKKDVLLKDINFERHSFIVGGSGFGKTNLMSILQENSLRNNKPIIFIDPKGDAEALNTFKVLCRSYNRPCYIFSEHYEDSITLNPVLDGSISNISERIMNSFDWSEQYYKNQSQRSLNKVLKQIKKDERKITLKRIYDYLIEVETKDNLGLIVNLENILNSDFGKRLSCDEGMTLKQVRNKRACLYIGLSTQGYGETAVGVGKLFLNELLYNSYKAQTSLKLKQEARDNPISVYFDEFGAIVTKGFIELQNKCRSAGIELTVGVQTASDIDRVDPDLTKQVIENTNNIFVMKQRLQDSAAFFAEAIGTTLSKKQTYKVENGEKQSSASEREVHELLVHPDIIKNLNVGQCVLLRHSPTQINLINIRDREQATFKKCTKLTKNKGLLFD